jgi:two-component system, cell cycle response regulator
MPSPWSLTSACLRWLRAWPWAGFLAVQVVAAMVLSAVVPLVTGDGPVVEITTQTVLGLLPGVAILVGVGLHRPVARAPWYLLASATTTNAIGYALFLAYHSMLHDYSFPAPADAFAVAFYLQVFLALVLFVRRRTPGRDLAGTVDAGILVVGAGLLSWVFLISPSAYAAEVPGLIRVTSTAYPMLDLLLLAVTARLMLGVGIRTTAFRLLTGFALLLMVTDVAYGIQSLLGTPEPGVLLQLGWFTATCLLATAALHPSMRRIDERCAAAAPYAGAGRLALLATASLMAPAVLATQYGRGDDTHIPTVVVACVLLFLLVMARMADMVRAQRQVAVTDALTGLRTRRYFEEAMATESARAERSGKPVGLLIIDVDHFKRVNDQYGHIGGDRVLCEVAARLRAAARSGDVVARYGGEEFAVVLPEAGEQELVRIGERIRTRLAGTPIDVDDKTWISVTASIGAAALPTHGGTPDELVLVADRALYVAKETGRNRLVVGQVERTERQEVS